MKSTYKRIGDCVQEVIIRNVELKVSNLQGISIDKFFMLSVANIIGTDMTTYKIVKPGQFACNRMHVGRDNRLPIALSRQNEDLIVSPAYDVFEIIDKEIINSDYLMMWFSRSEYDRNAWFYTDADVRGGLSWDAFCNMILPIPSILKQKKIVQEYNVIVEKIKTSNTLLQMIEETIQAIYNQWFVEFEFPNENENPYKSYGGELEYSEEFDREIPKNWKVGDLQEIIAFKNGKLKPNSLGIIPVFGGNGIIDYINEYNNENIIAIGRVGAYCGSLYRVFGKCWISDNAISAKSKKNYNMYSYYLLRNLNLNGRSEGTSQPLITQGLLNAIRVIIPKINVVSLFENSAEKLFVKSELITKELGILDKLKKLLLSKLSSMEDDQ